MALGLVALGFALAATLASALAAAAATTGSACAVNVRKFLNLEITHVYYSCKKRFDSLPRFFPRERRS
jgi:hypothetical protein